MPESQLIAAAQYLRMSAEHQHYSLQNQSTAIQKYAETHGFEVVRTYSDAARSGVVLKHRAGLRQLLEDVFKADARYLAILVYDVSRWGRFQDTDEAAHYEFLCKSAGVPVHYCAETFANDGTLPSLIMKALKRTMAGEYSRELGVKVFAGQKRLTLLGFKTGGRPGYGLRRMLVSASGDPKHELAPGEQKSIATDRVIQVPGPAHEIQTVKEIYRLFTSEKRSTCYIARKLNSDGIPRPGSSKWDHFVVRDIVTNPKYAGWAVFGRATRKLHTTQVRLPKSEWIVKPDAFEPVIDPTTFAEAQRVRQQQTLGSTNETLLDDLRSLLASEGKVSRDIILNADIASPSTYRYRFGSLRNAYRQVGYVYPSKLDSIANSRRHHFRMHEDLIERIARAFPQNIVVIRRRRWRRSLLRLRSGLIVSVLIVPSALIWKQTLRWIVRKVNRESRFLTLLARLDESNNRFLDFHVFPRIEHRHPIFQISLNDDWLSRGKRLTDLSEFYDAAKQVHLRRR